MVPLPDSQYVSQLEMMIAALKITLEHRNKRTEKTVRTWLSEAAAAVGVIFSVPVTLHTFRHSFAIICPTPAYR